MPPAADARSCRRGALRFLARLALTALLLAAPAGAASGPPAVAAPPSAAPARAAVTVTVELPAASRPAEDHADPARHGRPVPTCARLARAEAAPVTGRPAAPGGDPLRGSLGRRGPPLI